MTAETTKEYHVGDGWRYQCRTCGFQVGIDSAFPENCPGCHAAGWWGHLTPAIAQNNGKRGGDNGKNSAGMMAGGIKTRNRILSQQENAVGLVEHQNNGISEPSLERGRGRPFQPLPEDLIKELDHQGLSSRGIAEKLNKQGICVSYKTVQRRLQASFL